MLREWGELCIGTEQQVNRWIGASHLHDVEDPGVGERHWRGDDAVEGLLPVQAQLQALAHLVIG